MTDAGERLKNTAGKEARRDHITYLVIFLVLVGALWGFAAIADEVMKQEVHTLDETVLLLFRDKNDLSRAIGPEWFPEAMRDVTALGGNLILTLLTLGVVGYLLIDRKFLAATVMALAVISGVSLSSLLKMLFSRPRPDLVPHNAEVFTASFPSGHSMLSAVVYLTLAALLVRVQDNTTHKAYIILTAVTTSILVGVSRVYLGVHWPSDVLAGWCVGAAWAMLWWIIALEIRRFRDRRSSLRAMGS